MSTAATSPASKWLVTGAGMAGAVAMVLSSTIANVAVPTVMGAFGVGQDQAQWLATGFVATMVASQLLSAWFARAFGVRGTFMLISCVFFAGTAFAVFGATFEMVVVGRVLQGFSAGIVQPMTMALIFTQFPPERRGQAMAIHGMGIQIAPMLGPMIGGLVIDTLGWREIFLVPIPICVVALLLGMVYLPGREEQGPLPKFDWIGYSLLIAMLSTLLFAGANGQRFGWGSDAILILVLIGLAAGGAFVWLQLRSASPLLDFSLFKVPQFTSAVIVAFVFGFGNFSANYLIPVTVQHVQGFTPFLSGLLLVPAGVLVISATSVFGRVADVFPARLMVMLGLCLFALGNYLMSQTDANTTFLSFAWLVIVARCGMALIIPSLNTSALRALTSEQLHRGSGTINFIRQLGGACGVTALVVFIERRTQFHVEAMAATQTAANTTSLDLLSKMRALLAEAGVSENLLGPGALHYLGEMIEEQAIARGFSDGFLIIALVFVLAVIPAWNLGRARRGS
ncbi:MAG TPA: DHA2 family efflux MFS transporter permease subunit [Burkholderiales bacterium]|nr:DHA2 family efflux MFS transporter permease subunit [Burkholderiales bacterium]